MKKRCNHEYAHLKERLQFFGLNEHFPRNIQRSIIIWFDPPFYQGYFTILDFNPSDTAGMNTTSIIEIVWSSFIRKPGTMCVACNQHMVVNFYPSYDLFFNGSLFLKFFPRITGSASIEVICKIKQCFIGNIGAFVLKPDMTCILSFRT